MGFFDNLGGKIINGAREAEQYYREGLDMPEGKLKFEIQMAKGYYEGAKYLGYMKAAKERGIDLN